LQYAEKHGQSPAGCKFEVNKQCIREWCKQKKKLENALKSKRAFRGKQNAFPQIEGELYAYVVDLRKSGYAVPAEMLQLEPSKIA
jgi:hypothetical protein